MIKNDKTIVVNQQPYIPAQPLIKQKRTFKVTMVEVVEVKNIKNNGGSGRSKKNKK
jgi:hypothetical protein